MKRSIGAAVTTASLLAIVIVVAAWGTPQRRLAGWARDRGDRTRHH